MKGEWKCLEHQSQTILELDLKGLHSWHTHDMLQLGQGLHSYGHIVLMLTRLIPSLWTIAEEFCFRGRFLWEFNEMAYQF